MSSTLSSNNIEVLTVTGSAGQRVDPGKTCISGNQMTVTPRSSSTRMLRAKTCAMSI